MEISAYSIRNGGSAFLRLFMSLDDIGLMIDDGDCDASLRFQKACVVEPSARMRDAATAFWSQP